MRKALARVVAGLVLTLSAHQVAAGLEQVSDPGIRQGAPDAGGPLPGVAPTDLAAFWKGWERFKQTYSVSGTLEQGVGLGPNFNALSCAQCHAQPSAGGSSSSPSSPQVHQVVLENGHTVLKAQPNPQIQLASLHREPGSEQSVPAFLDPEGPIRVARFVTRPDGVADGTVHAIYTIAGRVDAPGCSQQQPDFGAEAARNNVVFRVPTPLFGAGLVEAVSDTALERNLAASAHERGALGIGGHFNRTSPAGRIGRFGWKAQTASVAEFSAESQNIEIGATNSLFPTKHGASPPCGGVEDKPVASDAHQDDVSNFAAFARFSAPAQPRALTAPATEGRRVFAETGCQLCHSATLESAASAPPGLAKVTLHPYSDFALHHMGPQLADRISQGAASGDEFRTAPLWGLGQRIFFMHDGRTTDLIIAIRLHASGTGDCSSSTMAIPSCKSEANAVVERFDALPATAKSQLLAFLRSL